MRATKFSQGIYLAVTDKILVTGAAGFIGYHLCERLMRDGYGVIGIDNLNDYYDPALKQMRLAALSETRVETGAKFQFFEMDLADGLDRQKHPFKWATSDHGGKKWFKAQFRLYQLI